jgi:hypothetical protein
LPPPPWLTGHRLVATTAVVPHRHDFRATIAGTTWRFFSADPRDIPSASAERWISIEAASKKVTGRSSESP